MADREWRSLRGSLPRCVYWPQPWVDGNPDDRSGWVAVDVQAVFSRPGNFEFVGCNWSQQNRLAHRQIVAGGGVPGRLDFERSSLASHLCDGVRGKGIAGNYAVEFLRSEDNVRARSPRRQLGRLAIGPSENKAVFRSSDVVDLARSIVPICECLPNKTEKRNWSSKVLRTRDPRHFISSLFKHRHYSRHPPPSA